MAETPAKSETALHAEEERLAHALISRGLVTLEEIQQCRSTADATAEGLVGRLLQGGFLTSNQARRVSQELTLLMGQHIPGYQLLEKLGQGSMGAVIKARQLSMNRLVAIKILKAALANNPEYLERFTREARLAAKLSHNNIVQAIDVGSAGKIHYFVMEHVEGTPIKEELKKGKIYEEQQAVQIVLQVAQALQHAHRRGLIHRDIKPGNIILTAEGVAKLADLGMARETADQAVIEAEKGVIMGTPFYIAPEQIRGQDDIDVRADIYSLGATLYHMVTGQPPFPWAQVDQVLKAHLQQELTPPDHLNTKLSAGLGEVVEFMMAKDRDQRYRTPDDLIIDLECLLAGAPPKLARERIAASALKALAEGDEEREEEDKAETQASAGSSTLWISILALLLALSVVCNIVLILTH